MRTAKINRFGSRPHKKQFVKFTRCFDDLLAGFGNSRMKIEAEVGWDTRYSENKKCNKLYITAKIYRSNGRGKWVLWHDDPLTPTIVKYLPTLQDIAVWELSTNERPFNYDSAVYHAGDRDSGGHRAGEAVACEYYVGYQHGSHGVFESALCLFRNGKPEPTVFKTKAVAARTAKACGGVVSEHVIVRSFGKSRDLGAARILARWPEATDKQLSQDPKRLRRLLERRLPLVMARFRKDVEAIGLKW